MSVERVKAIVVELGSLELRTAALNAELEQIVNGARQAPAENDETMRFTRVGPRSVKPEAEPEAPAQDLVLSVFRNGDAMRLSDIARATRKTLGATGAAMTSLVRRGKVERVDRGLYRRVRGLDA